MVLVYKNIFFLAVLSLFLIEIVFAQNVNPGCYYCDGNHDDLWSCLDGYPSNSAQLRSTDCKLSTFETLTHYTDICSCDGDTAVFDWSPCTQDSKTYQRFDPYTDLDKTIYRIYNNYKSPLNISACVVCRGIAVPTEYVTKLAVESGWEGTYWYVGTCDCDSDPYYASSSISFDQGCYARIGEGWAQCFYDTPVYYLSTSSVGSGIGIGGTPDFPPSVPGIEIYNGFLVTLDYLQNYEDEEKIRYVSQTMTYKVCNPPNSCPLSIDCPGDVNGDGEVNDEDLAGIVYNWLSEGCEVDNSCCGGADLNGDGVVNMVDFAIVTGNLGNVCE